MFSCARPSKSEVFFNGKKRNSFLPGKTRAIRCDCNRLREVQFSVDSLEPLQSRTDSWQRMPSKYLHFCLSKKKVTIFEPKVEGRSHGSRRAQSRWVTRKSVPHPRLPFPVLGVREGKPCPLLLVFIFSPNASIANGTAIGIFEFSYVFRRSINIVDEARRFLSSFVF